jgi:hypothetical protein|nr:MAG TPA: Protein of unknown function (DUF551) [Caudoviricetes sp.]
MSDKRKIYDYIKKTINPYGRPFEGTAYEFGLKLMDFIENIDGEKANGWIPVSERLPEESDYYMAYIYNEILNKYYCRSEWFSINNNYYGELVWIDLKSYEKVVAWRSLPEPYKEDEP